jgi:hypothetical protein
MNPVNICDELHYLVPQHAYNVIDSLRASEDNASIIKNANI